MQAFYPDRAHTCSVLINIVSLPPEGLSEGDIVLEEDGLGYELG